jgi:hypothetical protein
MDQPVGESKLEAIARCKFRLTGPALARTAGANAAVTALRP